MERLPGFLPLCKDGGGGIGDLAISQGYQRFNSGMIVVTVVILIVLINSIQFLGNYLYHKIKY